MFVTARKGQDNSGIGNNTIKSPERADEKSLSYKIEVVGERVI